MSANQNNQFAAGPPPMAEDFGGVGRSIRASSASDACGELAEKDRTVGATGKPAETRSAGAILHSRRRIHTVEELSETIIPADSHSGGAKAAKVADYIDQRLHESIDENRRSMWHEGIRLVDLMSKHFNGKSFVDSSSEQESRCSTYSLTTTK